MLSNLLQKKEGLYISADKEDSQVIVSVKDTGQGIDPEMLTKLFTSLPLNLRQEQV